MGDAPIATIGLGSNLGDRAAHLAAARLALTALSPLRASSVYETTPWGPIAQGPFLNQVVQLSTTLRPHELLNQLMAIEQQQGRDRAAERRWGPRTLDLDLLAYGDYRIVSPRLRVPHPELTRRAFVLVPWAELAPEHRVPGLGRTAQQLAASLTAEARAQVQRV